MNTHYDFYNARDARLIDDLPHTLQHAFIESSEKIKIKAEERIMFGEHRNMIGIVKKGILKLATQSSKNLIFTLDVLTKDSYFSTKTEKYFGNSFFIEAVTESEIYLLPPHNFLNLLQQSPEALQTFLNQTIKRNFSLYKLLMRQVFCDNRGKIASVLIQLGRYFGKQYGKYILIDQIIKHYEIGSFIGTSRESVTKTMAELKRDEIISYVDKKIVIMDYPRLLRYVFGE